MENIAYFGSSRKGGAWILRKYGHENEASIGVNVGRLRNSLI